MAHSMASNRKTSTTSDLKSKREGGGGAHGSQGTDQRGGGGPNASQSQVGFPRDTRTAGGTRVGRGRVRVRVREVRSGRLSMLSHLLIVFSQYSKTDIPTSQYLNIPVSE
jgi:hypothetical protein